MKKNWQCKGEEGFTLIELLMVMAIFGIIMVAIQAMFIAGMDVLYVGREDSKIRAEIYVATEEITKAIRNTPRMGIELKGADGLYDEVVLNLSIGEQIRYFLQGDQLKYEKDGSQRIIAEGIESLEFSVTCDSFTGVYDSYSLATLQISDSDGGFANRDPDIKGMVIRFENKVGGETKYIYRKIVNYGENWIEIDSGFSLSNQNYAIGNTYQIYIKTLASGNLQSKEIITGVTPRF